MTIDQAYFAIESAADDPRRIRHPMSDLASVEQTMDEIEARAKGSEAPATIASLNTDRIWADYRKGKGTPVSVHRLK
jgi:hypothetical protein